MKRLVNENENENEKRKHNRKEGAKNWWKELVKSTYYCVCRAVSGVCTCNAMYLYETQNVTWILTSGINFKMPHEQFVCAKCCWRSDWLASFVFFLFPFVRIIYEWHGGNDVDIALRFKLIAAYVVFTTTMTLCGLYECREKRLFTEFLLRFVVPSGQFIFS